MYSNDVFLSDLDRQLVVNYNEQRTKITGFPGHESGRYTGAQ